MTFNASQETTEQCEICLVNLSDHDKAYPLLCPVSSGTNICFNCLSHLVKTSNTRSDVKTLCPRCQNDISFSIDDTFMMRKVMKMQSSTANVPDSELSAAELRFKHSVTKEEIEKCKQRLEQFQNDISAGKVIMERKSSNPTRNNNGNDNSTIEYGKNSSDETKKLTAFQIMRSINCDLFQGMQGILSEAEQTFVYDLMTSGDVEKLAQSCHILSELRRIHQESESTNKGDKNTSDSEIRAFRMTMSSEERRKIEEVEQYLDWSPLPRLPKYISLEANFDVYAKHGKVLKFRDDGWDGSVSDAFARAYSTSNITDVQIGSFESDSGFHNDEEDGFVNGGERKSRDNRVVIYAARKQAAAIGIEVGDVVTHIDGNEYLGTAKELRGVIHNLYTKGNQMFTMILNAEQVTADALKDFAVVLNR